MIAFLEPLSRLPGVEFVLLISHDGVPIAHAGAGGEPGREDAIAALAASWLNDITAAVAPLTWNPPERICLRAAREAVQRTATRPRTATAKIKTTMKRVIKRMLLR